MDPRSSRSGRRRTCSPAAAVRWRPRRAPAGTRCRRPRRRRAARRVCRLWSWGRRPPSRDVRRPASRPNCRSRARHGRLFRRVRPFACAPSRRAPRCRSRSPRLRRCRSGMGSRAGNPRELVGPFANRTLCGLRRPLIPLVMSTIAAQSSIVVLVPIVVEVADDLDTSVSAVGQARAVLAITAVVAALVIGPMIDRAGVRPLLTWGSALALLGAGASAAAPSVALFLLAHVITGTGVACLLSAGFAGVGAWFPEGEMARPMGFVVGAQSVSWIIGNPVIGILTDAVSWRLAYVVPGVVCLASLVAARLASVERDDAIRGVPDEREGLR